MEQIFPENWALMHYGIILSLTAAQMLVVYSLSDSSNPPAGLGLYTVYFMAALLGWIAFTLQQGSSPSMGVDVPTVASILNSYILFLANGQRAGETRGRTALGAICVGATLCVFFLPPEQMFLVHSLAVSLLWLGTGLLAGLRGWRQSNTGDAIVAGAALLLVIALPLAGFKLQTGGSLAVSQAIMFGAYSAAYALVVVGFLASVAIEYQHHLAHLATEDPLTRLLNRRGLTDALQLSMAAAARHRHSTAVIMADIDHFKTINDSFGHETGDRVIQQVARILDRMCRSSDVVARTGGEEFLLVLPNTDLESARVLAERIRLSIGEHPLLVDQQRIPVTISLGVAATLGEVDLDELYDEADRAMYIAKRGGRNRVASVEHKPVQLGAAARD